VRRRGGLVGDFLRSLQVEVSARLKFEGGCHEFPHVFTATLGHEVQEFHRFHIQEPTEGGFQRSGLGLSGGQFIGVHLEGVSGGGGLPTSHGFEGIGEIHNVPFLPNQVTVHAPVSDGAG
jgi:hypothetical protein